MIITAKELEKHDGKTFPLLDGRGKQIGDVKLFFIDGRPETITTRY